MASAQTPAPVVQNENVHLQRGKTGNAAKSELCEKKKKKKGAGNRKALAVICKPGESLAPQAKDTAIPKAKHPSTTAASAAAAAGESKILNDPLLTEEDIRMCKAWADEGIERLHCPCNHSKQVERDIERIVMMDELDMLMPSKDYSLSADDDLDSPRMDFPRDSDPFSKLELCPEVALPCETGFSSISDDAVSKELDALLTEVWQFCSFKEAEVMLKKDYS